MSTGSHKPPEVSVVMATRDRCEPLRLTLSSLVAQRFPEGGFEVIVTDDGLDDGTSAMVRSFSDRLTLHYHHENGPGFLSAAQAGNTGARLASAPVLVFLEAGVLAGPDLLASHLTVQTEASAGRVAIGDVRGRRPDGDAAELAEAAGTLPPEEILRQYRDASPFRECRRGDLARARSGVTAGVAPWLSFRLVNTSLRTADFWEAGGFDESFRGRGVEDIELGFRLFARGIPFVLSPAAWALGARPRRRQPSGPATGPADVPGSPDVPGPAGPPSDDARDARQNALRFLLGHPHPAVELTWALSGEDRRGRIEGEFTRLLAWTERCRDLPVTAEIEQAVEHLPEGADVVVLGCGGTLPDALPPGASIADFDPALLEEAAVSGDHRTANVIGIRTPFADRSADVVVITSRLAGVWAAWHREILAEAHRIGTRVYVALPVPAGVPAPPARR
ncbi:MAG: hypothetical protein QG622_740 [Actinomycetota bacterium]|nr:hypothetical protein [Actinomycetota bacterium]